jgi:hypothetical protein
MIYRLDFLIDHPIYKLHEAIGHFFEDGLREATFSDQCVPEWFRPVLNSCPELKKKLASIHADVITGGENTRSGLVNAWRASNDIERLCLDPAQVPLTLERSACALTTRKTIRELFDLLYEGTLDTKCLKEAIGSSIDDHYVKFRGLGQRACPFCGIEDYRDRDSGGLENYDHYLARSHYPLAAVNFKNLIPMCPACNQRLNKGTRDVLYADLGRTTRRVFYYPYGPVGGVQVEARCDQFAAPGRSGDWHVSLSARLENEQRHVDAWREVFNIDRRYTARLRESEDIWVKRFIGGRLYQNSPSVQQLRQEFHIQADRLQ